MYHLVLTVCLVGAPEYCRKVELEAQMAAFTPMQCFTAAKSEVTRWARANPDYAVQKWKCAGKKQ